MDHDENDFQNQNFELTREDIGKFPSILRPFSLPKFDIDEPLHVPVRFDSLPEPDCLFTITGLCPGSNWINNFSPQNSTTKTKNVWSEATSSESVEMLLKSVREEEPIMDSGVPRESLNGTDYSHMMDMDPSGSMLDHSDDRQVRSSAEECITEEKHIENPLDSTKLPESSEGLLEAITYPIRNLSKEMQNKEISPLAERYGIDTQFENASYPRIGTLMGSGEENKELSDDILNMGEKEKPQLETEQSVNEDCEKTKYLTSSIDDKKQKDMAAVIDEQGVIGKETSSKERDLISITDNVVVSDGMVPNSLKSLKSQSNEQVMTRDGSAVSDAMKEQSGSDHTAEIETPPSMPAQDNMRPHDHSSGIGKEASTDLSDSVMAPKAVIIGSVSKETLLPQADEDKILICPPPSMEGKSSPMTSETDLGIGITKANTISADEAQGSNPCTEDIAKDDTVTAGTGTDNNQSSPELTCGSPTIISGRLDETKEDGVSDDLAQDANKGKHVSEGSNCDAAASEDDKSFSFNVVANIPERETVPDWKPFSSMKSPDCAMPSKGSSKGRALLGNTTRNKSEATKDVNTPKTEAKTPDPSPKKKRERKKTQSTPSPIKMETMKKHPEGSSSSSSVKTPSSASGLPDLSASASSAQLPHQPFTDLQHVQLRAQIFVYGSLIQGVPPSETYMVSAFGDSGVGRKKWEAAWRTAMERYQKSPLSMSTPETPGSSRPVHRLTESTSKESAAKRKSSAPGNKASTKQVPTTTVPSVSPILPASMPRGTHLDFTQNVSPSPMFNPYQPLQVKQQLSGTGTPWLSPSHPSPWLLPAQSSVFKTTPVSPVPTAATISTTAEASKITPRRKTPSTSVPLPPSLPVVFPPTIFPAIASPANTIASIAPVSAPSNVIATVSPPASIGATDAQKTVASPLPTVPPTTTPKTRKRKKAPATPEIEPEKPQVSSPMALIPTSSPPTQPKIIFTGQLASGTSLVTPTSPMSSYPVVSANISVGPSEHSKTTSSEDTSSRIEQSKLHAEDAAVHAAAAVRYSQCVWSQLAAQRNSGLTLDVEQKLASAAVAAAAAAAVAKAAAAAAKVASEAALQAKVMAEELARPPLMSEKTGPLGSVQTSFISMARETAKKRVEAASAAAKRAENLDAVIRAADLAAEAVSQAGVVVAMGDPLPLGIKDLLDAGPEGYWKLHFSKTEIEKQLPATTSNPQLEVGEARPENQEKVKDKSLSTQKVPRNTDAGKTSGDVPVAAEKDIAGNEPPSAKEKEIGFQKGSQIEVFADEASLRGVWFHATVLNVEENRIHVCYTDRFADEELGQVKEWIVLRNEGDKPPRVRAAHPATGPKPEGTRKRRREAVGSSSWDVGDHVDAWIRDGWREGIVTEKSDGDGTKYTVQFLVAGGSSVVESWHLRPSLIWQDGQWSLWSRSLAKKTYPKEGESPYEKRQRFGQLESDPNQATTAANANSGPVPQKKPEDSRPLNLPADDKVLTVGKFTMGETNSKHAHPGPQKEGSRVVFGVPRPGKKKKYMDVSKHYDGEKPDKVAATATEANSNPSVKLANYLMPQNRAPKSKVELKVKEVASTKQRAGVKSGKSHALNSSETSLDSSSEQRVPPRKKLGTSLEHDVEGKGKAISSAAVNADRSLADSSEPRRSNRRIQPTSRLLEGLQSSLMIAKMPTDKGTRTTLKGGVPSKDRVNG